MSDGRRIEEVEDGDAKGQQSAAEGERSPAPPALAQTTPVPAMLDTLLARREVLENLPDIVSVMDQQHRILYLNHTIPGHDVAAVIGTSGLSYIAPADLDRYQEIFERAWTTGERQTLSLRTLKGLHWESTFVPLKQNGQVAFMLGSNVDVTERRRAEAALRESERRLRHAISASGMGTWELRRGLITWDEALCQIFGVRPEEAPRRVEDFLAMVHPEEREAVTRLVARHRETGVHEDFEHRLIRPDGEVRHVISRGTPLYDEAGQPIGFLGGVFDITARKRLEAQLHQAQKMEAVGQLTAGIAHNFNNALSVIIHNAALSRDGADEQTTEQLSEIEYAAQRAAEMVRQLMIFARADSHARKGPMDLARSARRTMEMCRRTMDPRICLDLEIGADVPAIEGNPGQIEQVLLNICLNARDALESAKTPSPRITIRIAPGRPGEVRARVADNGPGMTDQVRTRVFEPFFTTKEIGRGTGLGLAMAYSIVADHRGRIECESRVGAGTSFELVLPIATGEVSAGADAGGAVRGGDETVLLIDDDASVRRAIREILLRSGYGVLEAGDGPSGVALFERERGRIDVVVLDRSMPHLSGEAVLERLSTMDTRIPIVLLSGHPGAPGGGGRSAAVLSKPTDRTTLLRTLREVLDRG